MSKAYTLLKEILRDLQKLGNPIVSGTHGLLMGLFLKACIRLRNWVGVFMKNGNLKMQKIIHLEVSMRFI